MLIIEGYNDTKIKTQSISIEIINEQIVTRVSYSILIFKSFSSANVFFELPVSASIGAFSVMVCTALYNINSCIPI